MKKKLTELFMGKRVIGEKLSPPTFKATFPKDRPTEQEWAKEFKFGSRYGHRGSFYQKKSVYSFSH